MSNQPKVRRFLLPSFNPKNTKWGIIPATTLCDARVVDDDVSGKIVYIDGICVFFKDSQEGKVRKMKSLSVARFLSLLAGSDRVISAEHHKFYKDNRYVDVKVYEGRLRGLIILEVTNGRLPDFAGGAVDITDHPDFTEDTMINRPQVTMKARKRIADEMFRARIRA